MQTEIRQTHSLVTVGDNIKIIVITGGPCSGKTTALAQLSRLLADRGYKVLISPESATKLIMAGMAHGQLAELTFQENILIDIIAQEDRIISIAKQYRDLGWHVIVLCDRGTMDGEAYTTPENFSGILEKLGYNHRDLCDGRYHAVIHLRTAALGAEEFYSLENNVARTESPEEARALDERTLKAWTRHQHPTIIDNSTDFQGKLRRLFACVCAIVGDPVPFEKEDKFLIEPVDLVDLPVSWLESQIIQDYLVAPEPLEERRVRARSDDIGTSYYYTIKREISPGVRAERERMISEGEYRMLLTMRDPSTKTICKRRICFFWKEQFFEIDIFTSPREGLTFLEAEQVGSTVALNVPPFIKIIRKLTGEKEYSDREIAKAR